MKKLVYWLSLALIFVIPWENAVEISAIGTISKLLGIVAAMVWGLSLLFTREFRKPTIFHICVGLFFVWNALTIFWTMDLDSSVSRAFKYAQLGVFVFLIWDIMRSEAALRAGMQAYVWGCLVSIGGILSGWRTAETAAARHTTEGFNPDDIGLVLALGIPFAWHLAQSIAVRSRLDLIRRWSNFAFVPIALFGILLTGTRGALIASVPALIYVAWSMRTLAFKWKMLAAAGACSLLVATLLIVPTHLIERFGTIPESIANARLGGRMTIWTQSIPMFLERPIVGVGSGAFLEVHPMQRSPHSIFVSVAVELGLVGLLLLAAVALSSYLDAISPSQQDWRMWLAVFCVLAIGTMVMNWEWRKQTWLMLSLLTSSAHIHLSQRRPIAMRERKRFERDDLAAQPYPATRNHPQVAQGC